jgi:hypothetical protein
MAFVPAGQGDRSLARSAWDMCAAQGDPSRRVRSDGPGRKYILRAEALIKLALMGFSTPGNPSPHGSALKVAQDQRAARRTNQAFTQNGHFPFMVCLTLHLWRLFRALCWAGWFLGLKPQAEH